MTVALPSLSRTTSDPEQWKTPSSSTLEKPSDTEDVSSSNPLAVLTVCAAHTFSTTMWFVVSVPVLSVQMQLADPMVSHAERCRTRARSCMSFFMANARQAERDGQRQALWHGDHHGEEVENRVRVRHSPV
jgi:hypothetical protein